jgi:hypothetical protein
MLPEFKTTDALPELIISFLIIGVIGGLFEVFRRALREELEGQGNGQSNERAIFLVRPPEIQDHACISASRRGGCGG